jgi:hypothetical protein
MRPLTLDTPKPLLPIAGKVSLFTSLIPLLDELRASRS